jgi:hypothetical protein
MLQQINIGILPSLLFGSSFTVPFLEYLSRVVHLVLADTDDESKGPCSAQLLVVLPSSIDPNFYNVNRTHTNAVGL